MIGIILHPLAFYFLDILFSLLGHTGDDDSFTEFLTTSLSSWLIRNNADINQLSAYSN